jgi:glycolate oxidase iron-sulfur subunit
LLACIHCGLCLEACPTYVATGDENDGPRGRLYLMRAVGEGRLNSSSQSFKNHIDRCLGCRACEQVCPAGVEYGQLLEAARAEIATLQPSKGFTGAVLNFALRHIWTNPVRLRLFFAAARIMRDLGFARLLVRSRLARVFSTRAEFAFALLDSSRPKSIRNKTVQSQTGARTGHVMLFSGCVGEGLFSHVNRATERVLKANGFEVESPREQVCCGALHAHAGDLDGARYLARRNIAAFSANENAPVITNAGGCGAMLASYGDLLAHDQRIAGLAEAFSDRVKDVAQQLETRTIVAGAQAQDGPVTYDASCHLLYGQHAADSSLRMLRSISGLNFVDLKGSERCCGGAGIYNLVQPEMSSRVLHEKLNAITNTGASVLTTGNPGCQMQIGAGACLSGMKLQVRHPIEVLDDSYANAGLYSSLAKSLAMSINRKTLAIFAPLLLIVGVLGFLVPAEQSLTSGATPYNIFHLIFGAVGFLILFSRSERGAIAFNVGFGLIDLYQAFASFVGLPPKQYFLWTRVDDALHIIIGLTLMLIGIYGILNPREETSS